MADGLPDSNPKTAAGARKPSLDATPPVALLELGRAMEHGRRKYSPMNWREAPVSASVYYNAALRHLLAWWDGECIDPESGAPHLAHVMACCAIVLDASAHGTLNDDRAQTTRAAASKLIRALSTADTTREAGQ